LARGLEPLRREGFQVPGRHRPARRRFPEPSIVSDSVSSNTRKPVFSMLVFGIVPL
jgi:hypothetical protein